MKTGRKPKHYRASDGRIINGLGKDPNSNRWRVIETGHQFRENDEAKAIAKFLEVTQPLADPPSLPNTLDEIARGFMFIGGALGGLTAEQRMMRWVGDQIRLTPALWAKGTGIEQLAYLPRLRPPAALPTFDQLERLFQENSDTQTEEKRKPGTTGTTR